LRNLFENSLDVSFQSLTFGEGLQKQSVTFLHCDGLIDEQMLDMMVFERFGKFFEQMKNKQISEPDVLQSLYAPGIKRVQSEEQIVEEVFAGKLITLFQNEHLLFSVDISKRPQRTPEETNTEVSIKGPRDNLIEDLTVNIALIRKRLRTSSLAMKT